MEFAYKVSIAHFPKQHSATLFDALDYTLVIWKSSAVFRKNNLNLAFGNFTLNVFPIIDFYFHIWSEFSFIHLIPTKLLEMKEILGAINMKFKL